MSYFAYLNQPGGCDYTIVCGNFLIGLKSDNLRDALIELKKQIQKNYTGDRQLSSVTFIEGVSINIDVNSIYDEIKKEKDALVAKQKEKEELELFKKLKNKFENESK